MGTSKGSAEWEGGLKDGKGWLRPAHATEAPFSVRSRFEGEPHSNPEELIGAALSGCFSMALTANLERAGLKPQRVKTSADVKLEKQAEGFVISGIDLSTLVQVSGIDDAKFQALAEETKRTCPVSKALSGTTITLRATLS